MRRLVAPVAVLLTLAGATSASAATINVPAGGTDGPASPASCGQNMTPGVYACPTLRDGVALANSLGGDPTLTLGSGTFTLTVGAINASAPMTIAGAGDMGSAATTISGEPIHAVQDLTVSGLVLTGGVCGALNGQADLALTDVTIAGDKCTGEDNSTVAGEGGGLAKGAAIFTTGTLTLTGSVITGNTDTGGTGGSSSTTLAAGSGGEADAAVIAGGLVMSGSAVSGNTATGGAGGTSTNGEASGDGGPVHAAGVLINGNAATIASSVLTDNAATGGDGGIDTGASAAGSAGNVLGGGLYMEATTASTTPVTITGTTFSGNTVEAGAAASDTSSGAAGGNAGYAGGAGLYANGNFPLQISGSTFSGNKSTVQTGGRGPATEIGFAGSAEGGAMYLQDGVSATIVNTTVSVNETYSSQGSGTIGTIGSFGAGIEAYSDPAVRLYSDTVAANQAYSQIGASAEFGANLFSVSTPVTLADTVLAYPEPSDATSCAAQSGGSFADDGHNLDDTAPSSCGIGAASGDQVGKPSLLLSLTAQPNGAAGIAATANTPAIPAPDTLALSSGSPAIGNGGACVNPLLAGSPALASDERGFARPAQNCDIGAFQSEPLTVTGAPVITGTPAVGQTLSCDTGTFATSGDGDSDSTGGIGAPRLSYTWSSAGATVAEAQTYTVTTGDQGHAVTCTETATGQYGSGSAASPAVSVPAAATVHPTTAVKLALTALGESRHTWAEKKRKHGPAVGTTFRYTLSTPATVTLSFGRLVKNGRVASRGRCVALTRKNAKKRRCTRQIASGSISQAGHTGANALAFAGRTSRGKLKPGNYVVNVSAVAAGVSTGRQTLIFTVAK